MVIKIKIKIRKINKFKIMVIKSKIMEKSIDLLKKKIVLKIN